MPIYFIKLILTALLLTLLSGCASYFERSAQRHCFHGDWLAHGFDSAKRGEAFNTAWQANDARCEKYNLWSNKRDFEQGYELGKAAFCHSDNGFEFGLRDKNYSPICQPTTQRAFDLAYHDGQRLYLARHEVQYCESKVESTLDFIDYARYKRRELAEEIDSGNLDDDTKREFVKKRYKLKKRRQAAVHNLPYFRARLREAEHQAFVIAQELQDFYDVDGHQTVQNYSINQTIKSENRTVLEPAAIVYLPEKARDGEAKRQAQEVSLLTRYVSENHSRSFRYQVLKNAELYFVSNQGKGTKVNLVHTYQHQARLLLWDPTQGLTARVISTAAELAPALSDFIGSTLSDRSSIKIKAQSM